MSVVHFIAAQRTEHRVPHAKCCRWLGVSESWFYKWRDRPPTPRATRRARLDEAVKASFGDSGGTPGTYGSPRVWEDLIEAGWKVSVNTVAASMARHRRAVMLVRLVVTLAAAPLALTLTNTLSGAGWDAKGVKTRTNLTNEAQLEVLLENTIDTLLAEPPELQ